MAAGRALVLASLLIVAMVAGRPTVTFAGTTLTVTTTQELFSCPSGAGQPGYSIECAIAQANTDGSGDTIAFDIPATDSGCSAKTIQGQAVSVCVLQQTGALPTITASQTTIDGYTQPGSRPNTNALAQGDNAIIAIQLVGNNLIRTQGPGLTLRGNGDVVEGLSITDFASNSEYAIDAYPISGPIPSGVIITGNFLGLAPDGSKAGDVSGIECACTVGGTSTGDANVISAMTRDAVDDYGGPAIQGNLIGTDPSGQIADGNGHGVGIEGPTSGSTLVGGTTAGAGNVISGSTYDGLAINGSNVTVQGNYIGTNATGTAALPNGSYQSGIGGPYNGEYGGVYLGGSSSVTIGGTTAAARNIISGNKYYGIAFDQTQNDVIEGNYIGLNAAGSAALPNGMGIVSNIADQATNSNVPIANDVIGGTAPGAANVISGNSGDGIELYSLPYAVGYKPCTCPTFTTVEGNLIGTDPSGTRAVPNGSAGIRDTSSYAGAATGTGQDAISNNVVSGQQIGLVLGSPYSTATGNLIGTNSAGTAALPNGQGVELAAGTLGGTTAGSGNVISGNSGDGVLVHPTDSNSQAGAWLCCYVYGNDIGTTSTGRPLPNGGDGVDMIGVGVAIIGGVGSGEGNLIADNAGAGVSIGNQYSVVDARVRGNSIHDNGGLGIDLWPVGSVTCTQPSGDTNDFEPCPVIQTATLTSVSGIACANCIVDVYAATNEADDHGHGEGKTWLGSTVADSNGFWTFNPTTGQVVSGEEITATATSPASGGSYVTSEFAQNVPVARPINHGWTLIDVNTSGGPSTASALVNSLDGSLGSNAVSLLATYQNGRYTLYAPGYSADFPLQPWQGIFVLSNVSGSWSSPGSAYSTAQKVPLNPGWNLVAVPYPPDGLTASQINSEIGTACGLQEIATYGPTGYTTWTPGSTQDLTIPSDSGFWMQCTKSATWTPS